jgi:hypothetical protein
MVYGQYGVVCCAVFADPLMVGWSSD